VITQQLPDGRTAILTRQGWRLATEADTLALQTPAWQAAVMGGLRSAMDTNDLMTLVNPFTWMGGPAVRDQAVTQATQALQDRNELFSPLDAAQPGATALGRLYLDPVNAASMAVGAKRLGQSMLQRSMARAQQLAGQVATQQAAPGATVTSNAAAAPGTVGASSAGRAGVVADAEGSFIRRQLGRVGWGRDLVRLTDELFQSAPMTPDQRALIPVADRIGFQFLPGQREGNQLLNQLATSDPLVQLSLQGPMSANRQGLRAALMRAIGINADDFSTDLLGAAVDQARQGFDDVAAAIGKVTLPDDIAQRVTRLAADSPYLQIDDATTLTGRQLMALRSKVDEISRAAWQAGRTAPVGQAEFADATVDMLDDLIAAQLRDQGDDAVLQAWRTTQQRWKNIKVAESPGVISMAREINPRSLDTAMRRYYKSAYLRQLTGEEGRRAGLLPETRQLMDWARVTGAFADNLPNSGTPYRTALLQMAKDPRELAKSLVLRQLIEARAAGPAP
jgi:hypothetical protein